MLSAGNAGDLGLIPGKIPWRRNRLLTLVFLGFPGGSDGKESACNAGDLGSITGLERSPREGHDNPFQYSCLENPHGQRCLAGYSPQGHKELDTIEQLRFLSMLPSGHPWWLSGKESACSARDTETQVLSLDREDPLEKEIATHSSIITWENPWTEKSGGLQFLGLQRVGHDWASEQQQCYLRKMGHFWTFWERLTTSIRVMCNTT